MYSRRSRESGRILATIGRANVKPNGYTMEKNTQLNLWFAATAFAALLLFQLFTAATTYEQIPYSQFQTYLKDGKIEEVVIHLDRIEGKFKAPLENGKINFVTQRVEQELASDLAQIQCQISGHD